ncbi:secondary thiamine-phosphate synthase enzyme [Marmoricola sp. URHA0025 HA25]
MSTHAATLIIDTEARITYTDITDFVIDTVRASDIEQGIVVVSSPHTTCSVVIQEASHDVNYYGTEFLMQDLTHVLETLAPRTTTEGRYLHPGPIHIEEARRLRSEEAWWSLNVDGHLRSVLLGRSESIPVVAGNPQLGEFGCVYFADFDQVRARTRSVKVVVVG